MGMQQQARGQVSGFGGQNTRLEGKILFLFMLKANCNMTNANMKVP